jgi:transposase
MSAAERERLVVVRQVIEGRLTQAVAAERLGLGVRQVKRLVRAYRSMGAKGLVSRQRGRVSPRRLGEAKRAEIAGLLSDKYQGFGPTLAAEKLGELEAIQVSRETVRGIQIAHGLWRAKRRREARVFSPRERRARFGELIQIDGSPHDWFEGRAPRASLIVFIDDATGQLTGLRFAPAETTRAYLETLKAHVLAHGLPLALYSDRHGIFRVNAKEAASGDGKTEFARVAERLGIELIHARTPQAKGRVERANQTLQDRLVKEMRLEAISGIAAANAFLPRFIARWNARFAVAPRDLAPAHRPWTQAPEALDAALARYEERTLSKSLTFRAQGRLYAIKTTGPGTALRGAKVSLVHHLDGRIEVRYKQRSLETTAFGPCRAPHAAEDEKSIDARLDAIIAQAATPDRQPGIAASA